MDRVALVFLLGVAAVASVDPGPGVVTLYFHTAWPIPNTFVHYKADDNPWTVVRKGTICGIWNMAQIPGKLMKTSDSSKYPGWAMLSIPANSLAFLFDNGQNDWYKDASGGNFQATPGIYSVDNHVATLVMPYPKGCPGNCSSHGTCGANYVCTCQSGYFDEACDQECPGGAVKPCNGRGTCDDGAHGNGTCLCKYPYGNCGVEQACEVDFSSDNDHCGACGIACKPGQGVVSNTCTSGKCVTKCKDGWKDCDGACVKGGVCPQPPLPGCQTFHENQCSGDIIITPNSFEDHRWYTPGRDDAGYRPSFQDYAVLVGYAQIVYASDLQSATVTVHTIHKNNASVTCLFGTTKSSTCVQKFDTSQADAVPLSIAGSDGSKIIMDPLDFRWQAPTVTPQQSGDYRNGQKGAIVEMFGWPHTEIAKECEFIAKAGYAGIKVFPPQESVLSWQPFQNSMNPWYFFYQPVSYRLDGRLGTREELRDMIHTCRKLGVRVYADAVVNHMVGGGNDANLHRNDAGSCVYWPCKNSTLSGGQGPSPMYTQDFAYLYGVHTKKPPSQEFPAAAYGPLDFHCERALNSWTDPLDLNAGWLTGLVDLNTEREYVQNRIAAYLTDLLSIGFSGFRMDAAKHIKPGDLGAIFGKVQQNMGGSLPEDFISWLEVLLGGESDLLMCNADSGYNYGQELAGHLTDNGLSSTDVDKIKIWCSGYPKEPDKCYCSGGVAKNRIAAQNDDADQQMPGSSSRDMGSEGCVLVQGNGGCPVNTHRGFEVKLFQSPNGADDNDNDYPVRMVLSSYYFPDSSTFGIPDGKSDCDKCLYTCDGCRTVKYSAAYDANSSGYDSPVYTRVHRDSAIISAMRSWMHLP